MSDDRPGKLSVVYKRLLEDGLPETSFFLFGPRQVGKSTLISTVPALMSVDLLDPDERLAYSKAPSILADRVLAKAEHGTVIIDEVQRVPALIDVVQRLLTERPELRFIMSGSSARQLRRGAPNMLGGRALYRELFPLTVEEMGDSFVLDKVLAFGSLPAIWTRVAAGEDELAGELLKAYVTAYLSEDVQAEALVRNLQGFQSFIDVAAAQFAEPVNYLGVSRDCQVAYATAREYFAILEDTLLGFFLRPYVKVAHKRMSHAPRFYFFDNGVTRALLGSVCGAPSAVERGRLFEQWFVQEVVRLNEYRQKEFELYFWRTGHGAEVDLLVEQEGRILFAIECTHRTTIGPAELKGFISLREIMPKVDCFFVAPVTERQKVAFATVVPVAEMLATLATQ
jgi:predicted AAA+ superfamily ATPase